MSAAADKEESFGTPSAPEVAGTKKRLTSAKAMPPVTVTQPELPLLEQSESSQPVEAGAPLMGEAAAVAVEEEELVESSGLVSTVSSELLSSEPSGAGALFHFAAPPGDTGAGTVETVSAPVTPRAQTRPATSVAGSPPSTPRARGPATSPTGSPLSAEMAAMVEAMKVQMLQSQAQMAQTQQMLQLMLVLMLVLMLLRTLMLMPGRCTCWYEESVNSMPAHETRWMEQGRR